jgi:hypothetical protein
MGGLAVRATHVAIDGSTVTIEATAFNPDFHASSVGVYAINGRWQEFTTSYRDFGAAVAADLGLSLNESYTLQGGRLRLGTTSVHFPDMGKGVSQTDLLHLAVWEGRRFSVHTHLYNGKAHDLIDVFDRFEVLEDADGIRLRPRDPEHTKFSREPSLLREVPNIGVLQVRPMTPQIARTVPTWQGTAVRGGELFVGRRPDSLHLVLVGKRSHTLIMRHGDECGKEDLSHIRRLSVDWRTPS